MLTVAVFVGLMLLPQVAPALKDFKSLDPHDLPQIWDFPLPTNSWYNAHVAPYQSSIGTTLQNCASSGLFYEVGLGQNISAALNELFQSAVASAHLTQ